MMNDDAYGATMAKRGLSRRLSALRKENGYTANQVCDMLNWGRGKVGRFEANMWRRPELSDIRDLLRVYEVDHGERYQLEELAVRARARGWWRDYPEIYPNEFPGYENDASRIRVFMPLVLPGLLQTPEYVEALTRAGQRPPLWRRKALETRLRRQEILARTGPAAPELIAVITEASLMYQWGTPADRYEQIMHLVEQGRRPGVDLRVQRFADGPPAGAHSMVNIFDFPDGEPVAVFLETDYAIEEVSEPDQIDAYIRSFDRSAAGALSPGEAQAYLEQLAAHLE
jgi:transcriptional regulator with XRE-family HTH domain